MERLRWEPAACRQVILFYRDGREKKYKDVNAHALKPNARLFHFFFLVRSVMLALLKRRKKAVALSFFLYLFILRLFFFALFAGATLMHHNTNSATRSQANHT